MILSLALLRRWPWLGQVFYCPSHCWSDQSVSSLGGCGPYYRLGALWCMGGLLCPCPLLAILFAIRALSLAVYRHLGIWANSLLVKASLDAGCSG